MKQNSYAKRSRHHSHGRGRSNQQFTSLSETGDHYDPRMKATAQQQLTKYLNLARDAASSGDRVLAEGYYQHADHYQRVLNTFRPQPQARPQQPIVEGPKEETTATQAEAPVETEASPAENTETVEPTLQ